MEQQPAGRNFIDTIPSQGTIVTASQEELIIWGFMFLIFIFLFLYYFLVMTKYMKGWAEMKEVNPVSDPTTFITILVPVRNEEQKIQRCLDSLMRQNYPPELFEVIVLDDFSSDKTAVLATQYSHVQVVKLNEHIPDGQHKPNKKQAINIGVRMAKGDLIACIDGDCAAVKWWLHSIDNYYRIRNPKFFTAPVILFSGEGLFHSFQQLDILGMTGITAAAIENQQPEMSNGGNMCFEKSTFLEINGFEGIDHLPTGDDVMLMQKIEQHYPGDIGYLKSLQAIVYTDATEGFGAFINQRKRWLSKSNAFPNRNTTMKLLGMFVVNASIPITIILGFLLHTNFFWIAGFLAICKAITDFVFLRMVARYFDRSKLMWEFPAIEFLHILYISFIGPLAMLSGYSWKGRKI